MTRQARPERTASATSVAPSRMRSAKRVSYSLRASNPADTVKWLRRKLAMVRGDPRPPKPRPLRRWLSGALSIGADELQPNLAVALYLGDGTLWLGDVRAANEDTLVLAPWGASEDMTVALRHVSRLKVLPQHSWAERRIVAERQRRGEPSIVSSRRKDRREETGEQNGT